MTDVSTDAMTGGVGLLVLALFGIFLYPFESGVLIQVGLTVAGFAILFGPLLLAIKVYHWGRSRLSRDERQITETRHSRR